MNPYLKDTAALDFSHIQVMGILNVTDDSFSDGGKFNKLNLALAHAKEMINFGASIIDVGGESTRPGASEVNTEEELDRVIPVIEAISQRFKVWISVDTSKPEVIYEAARSGAHIINDVRSLQKPGALTAAVKTGLFTCLVHMQGEPKTMQKYPHYENIRCDVNNFFIKHIKRCTNAGIKKSRILLDPGFGFGKNITHNYQLLANLSDYKHFGLPLLVGISRKSMVRQLLNIEISECLPGSLTCAVIAAMQGVHILRVHDVKETIEAVRIIEYIYRIRKDSII